MYSLLTFRLFAAAGCCCSKAYNVIGRQKGVNIRTIYLYIIYLIKTTHTHLHRTADWPAAAVVRNCDVNLNREDIFLDLVCV